MKKLLVPLLLPLLCRWALAEAAPTPIDENNSVIKDALESPFPLG
ncbi:MAG: hypothetical protein ACO3GO_03520 [Terrimicrobiaceae bacterium]